VPLRLTPQKREFFALFNQAAANAREISRLLVDLLNGWPESRGLLRDIREAEHEGDRLTHAVIDLLNRTFVTPFDRDDMYRLASVIDDVCDHVDEAADNIDAYEVVDVPVRAREQADVISVPHRGCATRSGYSRVSATRKAICSHCASSRTKAIDFRARRSPTCSGPARTRSRSSAGRTSTSSWKKPWTPARMPPTSSKRFSSRTADQ
jgi:hypothetical protein